VPNSHPRYSENFLEEMHTYILSFQFILENIFPPLSLSLFAELFISVSYFKYLPQRISYMTFTSFLWYGLMCLFLYRWLLLEVLDKVSPGSVNWKQASKPPIKMPFRKVENCNQVIKIGKQMKFSLVNLAGNDIVQGNKKLILGKSSISSCIWLVELKTLLSFIQYKFYSKPSR
jgi:hypothetical protein